MCKFLALPLSVYSKNLLCRFSMCFAFITQSLRNRWKKQCRHDKNRHALNQKVCDFNVLLIDSKVMTFLDHKIRELSMILLLSTRFHGPKMFVLTKCVLINRLIMFWTYRCTPLVPIFFLLAIWRLPEMRLFVKLWLINEQKCEWNNVTLLTLDNNKLNENILQPTQLIKTL